MAWPRKASAESPPISPRFKNLIGQVFNELTVIEYAGLSKHKATLWKCRCSCGKEVTMPSLKLRTARRSCGCRQGRVTHGMSYSSIYGTWRSMINRCTKPADEGYKHYGGRGIQVCDRWRNSFEAFASDMGPKPKGMTLDRRENDGDYSPENCRWATKKQQARNTRSSRILELNGQRRTIAEWSEVLGINRMTIAGRLHRGYSDEKALSITKNRTTGNTDA